jgi:endonuclease/exonuclease/phosphatase family metal-dependent hydrolase
MLCRFLLLGALLAGLGCAHGFNYADPGGPGCALATAEPPATEASRGAFEVVSFNIKFGKDPEGALRTLQRMAWTDADVYVLQEVDWRSTVVMAKGLARAGGMNAVYYPAARHPGADNRQFGVAIVSPWPIRSDQKILLPRLSPTDRAQKVALGATVWIEGVPVGVASIHLQSNLSPQEVERQAGTLFDCLVHGECPAGTPGPHTQRAGFVLAGDFNTWSEGHVASLRALARTFDLDQVGGIRKTFEFLLFRPTLDHVFALAPVRPIGSGEVSSLHEGSDHHPVRARLRLPVALPWQGFEQDVLQAGASRDEAVCQPAS